MRFRSVTVLGAAMLITFIASPAWAMYNPVMGRFMQRDPRGTALVSATGGPTRAMTHGGFIARDSAAQYADGMNLYQYVQSNPVAAVDPNGTVIMFPWLGGGSPSKPKLPPTGSITYTLRELASYPPIKRNIRREWLASNPNGAGGNKHEHGFWIIYHTNEKLLGLLYFTPGTRAGIRPAAIPSDPDLHVLASFHTHPNTKKEGYKQGPSPADEHFASSAHIPGIIRSHAGLHFYGPGSGQSHLYPGEHRPFHAPPWMPPLILAQEGCDRDAI